MPYITRLIKGLMSKPKASKKLDCLLACEFQAMGSVYRRNGGAAAKMICDHGTQIYETRYFLD